LAVSNYSQFLTSEKVKLCHAFNPGINWSSSAEAYKFIQFFYRSVSFITLDAKHFVVKSSGSSRLAPAAHTHPGRGILCQMLQLKPY